MTSFAWPCWEGCGHTQTPRGQTRWLPARAGARDHGGLPGLGGPGSPKGGRGAALAVPPSQPCPQLGGVTRPLWAQQQKRDGAGGRRGRAAPPQMRGALPAGARKPCSPQSPGSSAPHLPHPRPTVPRAGFPVLSGSRRALSPGSQPVPPPGPGRPAPRGAPAGTVPWEMPVSTSGA